jgi:hypothetical protein
LRRPVNTRKSYCAMRESDIPINSPKTVHVKFEETDELSNYRNNYGKIIPILVVTNFDHI